MNISDLYDDEFYEEKEKYIVDKIATFIKEDGFDISSFSLFSAEDYIWEFVSDNDTNKGFLLFYDPQVVNEPMPQYQLYSGCVYFTFDARNITEAYIQHNKSMSDEDYELLSKTYGNTENQFKRRAKEIASKYGSRVACDVYNCTNHWLHS